MAFGQQSGPPASAKQVQYLAALLGKAGYDGFRDARGPLGLTQRQAAGKFTSREASELIDRLLAGERGEEDVPGPPPVAADDPKVTLLRGVPADLLAAELERRGWTVTPPDGPR